MVNRNLIVRVRRVLFALVLGSAVRSRSRSCAQAQGICSSSASSTQFRVESPLEALALNAAVSCSDGGQLNAVWAGAVTLDGPISIGAGTFLSITGGDEHAEAQGELVSRLFDVSSGGGLTLTGLKLSGGSAENGGAIRSYGALTLDSCVFDQNVATGDGGAVWVTQGELAIVGGEFSNNTANQFGGAIFSIDGALTIQEDTAFEGNRAVQGGAVYCGGTESAADAAFSCSFTNVLFEANVASSDTDIEVGDFETPWSTLNGGGAAAFVFADVDIKDSLFRGNSAQLSGGALFGGVDTDIFIDGCTFERNTTPGYGGAIAASSMSLGGSTELMYNEATRHGGGVFVWDSDGTIDFGDVLCRDNTAVQLGGCFFVSGTALMDEDTTMRGNIAKNGGCIYAQSGCVINVNGGQFTCAATNNGGFLFVSDGAHATITSGLVTKNVAARRGAVVYCSGDSFGLGGSVVTIEGGTFTDNEALELGGALVAWGTPTVVTVKGGDFRNNTAKFYGGFIFLEEEASLICDGATIQENFAGDQGGGIYARDATWVNSSCDILGNESPQGAAAYLTYVKGSATFENISIADNLASGGSVIFAAHSSVITRGVTFESGVGLLEDSSNRAMQLDSTSSLVGEGCIFTGWFGDTVIHSTNAAGGSVVLDSCDFSGSAATMAVISSYSDAEIRNAVVSDTTLENAAIEDGSPVLVNRALNCSQPNACGAGACVDSSLGVLCECLEDGACLDGGGTLSLTVHTPPSTVTYSPDLVSFKLSVLVGENGSTPAIWNASFEADELSLEVVPSSGVLLPGGNITVTVTGSPLVDTVGGNLTSRFVLTSVGSDSTDSTAGVELEVESTFYLCPAFEYAVPNEDSDDGISCKQCVSIDGADGVNCDLPGASLAALPVREEYWRSSNESLVVHSCLHPEACIGATIMSSSDDYCKDSNKGPYCAVCAEGHARGSGNTCYSCKNTAGALLIAAGTLFSVMVVLLVLLVLVFLVGGLDAVDNVRTTVAETLASARTTEAVVVSSIHGSVSPAQNTTSASSGSQAIGFVPLAVRGERSQLSCVPEDDSSSNEMMPAGRSNALGTAGNDHTPGCCGVGETIKRYAARLPLDKLKILVVVWQILTVLPAITGVAFPPNYSRFLSWVDFINLDLGQLLSAACILPSMNFYERLLVTTLVPIGLVGVLVVTYHLAKRRAAMDSAGGIVRRAAWSRHMAAGLLLTFLVFTSTSTAAFKVFACDESAVEGESYLRADYSLSCKTDTHMFFRVYAWLMILVYPIGIPLLYAFILWKNRFLLNPAVRRVEGSASPKRRRTEDSGTPRTTIARPPRARRSSWSGPITSAGTETSPLELNELEERLEKRKTNPELVPSMFLWRDFGANVYYYEVIECGRRMLLTGVLIFIAPNSAAQVAFACIFAFASLLGFELLRPHLDPVDSWLYRLGCVVIFLSNFLALLIKVEAAGDDKQDMLGGLLVAINILLVLAVLITSWLATQQLVDDSREKEHAIVLAGTMLSVERLAQASTRFSRDGRSRKSSNALFRRSSRGTSVRSGAPAVGPDSSM